MSNPIGDATLGTVSTAVLTITDDDNAPGPVASCNGLTPTIIGTNGNDTLNGTAGPDIIFGGGGNDRISGLDATILFAEDPAMMRSAAVALPTRSSERTVMVRLVVISATTFARQRRQ